MIGGHNVWGQGRGVKVRGVVRVMGRGSMSGGLGSDGRWGRLKINSLFLSRTHDRIEFHSIPFHSNPFHSNPFHSIPCFTQCPIVCVCRKGDFIRLKSLLSTMNS